MTRAERKRRDGDGRAQSKEALQPTTDDGCFSLGPCAIETNQVRKIFKGVLSISRYPKGHIPW